MKKDFFISYNKSDKQWAKWIAAILETNGYSTIIQAWDFRKGDNFILCMNNALLNSDRFIAVISENYFNSPYCQAELSAVISEDPNSENRKIIPIRISSVKPQGLLSAICYIDLFGVESEKVAEKLVIQGVDKSDIPRKKPCFPKMMDIKFPGILPPNNLPYSKNPYFTGRENTIEKIYKTFQTGEYVSLTQTIKGLGGVGKTQIALEYVFRYANEYNIIWWIQSESSQTLLSSFTSFALKMSLIKKETTDEQVIKDCVISWLDNNNKWLFIYDNADDFNILKEYLPRNNQGHILVTTRFAHGNLGKSIDVTVFDISEAISFLIKRTSIDDDEKAMLIVERLGKLPLALEQAAAYIIESGIQYDDYLELLHEYGLKPLEQINEFSDYKIPITVTWMISIDKIKMQSAMQLLLLLSFFSPENIDLEFIIKSREKIPDPLQKDISNKLLRNKIVSELIKYSLVRFENEKMSIHRLLQEIIRDSIIEDNSYIQCNMVVISNLIGFEYGNINSHMCFLNFSPHAISILEHACILLSNDNKWNSIFITLYRHIALSLSRLGIYTDAIVLMKKAIKISETIFGDKHIETAFCYQGIAGFYCELAEYQLSENFFVKAISILENYLNSNDPTLGMVYSNVGWLYYKKRDYQISIGYYSKTIKILENSSESQSADIAAVLNNMGLVFHDIDDYNNAIKYYNKSLIIREKIFGKSHPDTALCYNNLGLTYCYMKETNTALEWHYKALSIREKHFGENHPHTATSYHNISKVFMEMQDYVKAIMFSFKAFTIRSNILGEMHPDTADSMYYLAKSYLLSEDYSKALKFYLKLRECNVKNFGENHFLVIYADYELGNIYLKQKKYDDALKHYNEALYLSTKSADISDKLVLEIKNNISEINYILTPKSNQ